jgi:carbamoyltransferase
MMITAPVRDEWKDRLAATTHVDGSSRMQRVDGGLQPRYDGLIRRFAEATGVPALLNTSFNLKGEPIVNSPAEAYATFRRSGLDVLVLDDCVILKS